MGLGRQHVPITTGTFRIGRNPKKYTSFFPATLGAKVCGPRLTNLCDVGPANLCYACASSCHRSQSCCNF